MMVIGLPELQVEHDGICKGCALGRYAKGPFLSSDNRSKGILDMVPSDACGPRTVSSLGGFWYHVIVIDYFYGNTWIYFKKDQG